MEWFSRRTAKTEKTCLKLRKYVGFAIEPFKKTFAKTLRQPCYNLELLQNIPKFLSIRTTFRRGEFPPTEGIANTVENPRNAMHFAVLSPLVSHFARRFAAKCTIFRRHNSESHFSIRNYSQFLFSQIQAMHTLMRRVDNGLEMKLWAFSICSAARNDLAPELDVSARLATIFLSKLFWQSSCTHLYPIMT